MDQFIIQKIRKNIFLIRESGYHECANIYLFQNGHQGILVDTGVGMHNISAFLKERKIRDICVVITHSHFDHIGGMRFFRKEDLVLTPEMLECAKQKNLLGLEYLLAGDFDRSRDFPDPDTFVKTFSLDTSSIMASKYETVGAGDFSFVKISAPGHSSDSILLYDAANKILVTGDSLYDGEPYYDLPNSDVASLKQTIALIKTLDFEILLPGHNQVLDRQTAFEVADRWLTKLS